MLLLTLSWKLILRSKALKWNACIHRPSLFFSNFHKLDNLKYWTFWIRTSYNSNNLNLYPQQSRISFRTLLWDTLHSLQSRTGSVQGQNREFPAKFSTQGKTCFYYREPLFSLQGPLFSLQGFPCEKTSQGEPCFHYREWVCSEYFRNQFYFIDTIELIKFYLTIARYC